MTDSVAEYSSSHSCGTVLRKVLWISCLHDLEINSEVANVAASVVSRYLVERHACTFPAFVYGLEQLSLLRVHRHSFAVVYPEEFIFELSNVPIQKVSSSRIHAAWPIDPILVIEGVDIESRTWYVTLPRTTLFK